MFASPMPMGHFNAQQIKVASMTLGMVNMELERLKRMPCVVDAEVYLAVLNKCVSPHSSLPPPPSSLPAFPSHIPPCLPYLKAAFIFMQSTHLFYLRRISL